MNRDIADRLPGGCEETTLSIGTSGRALPPDTTERRPTCGSQAPPTAARRPEPRTSTPHVARRQDGGRDDTINSSGDGRTGRLWCERACGRRKALPLGPLEETIMSNFLKSASLPAIIAASVLVTMALT